MRRRGWLVLIQHGGLYSGRGRSDLLVCALGRFIALEIKTQDGSASPAQRIFLEEVRRAGGRATVVRSPDEAEQFVLEVLRVDDPFADLFDESPPKHVAAESRDDVPDAPSREALDEMIEAANVLDAATGTVAPLMPGNVLSQTEAEVNGSGNLQIMGGISPQVTLETIHQDLQSLLVLIERLTYVIAMGKDDTTVPAAEPAKPKRSRASAKAHEVQPELPEPTSAEINPRV